MESLDGVGIRGHHRGGAVVVHNAAGPGADPGEQVVLGIVVVEHTRPHGRMPAGGIPGHDHPLRVHAEPPGIFAQEAHGVAGVLYLGRKAGYAGVPVLHNGADVPPQGQL